MNMSRIIVSLFAVLLFPLMVSAQDDKHITVDERPKFSNSKNDNTYDLNEYVTKHFVYPVDQMKKAFLHIVDCNALISSEGKVKAVEILENDVLDSFKQELFRVLSNTIWTPAMLNGKYISYWQSLSIIIGNYNTNTMPNYIASPFRKVKKHVIKDKVYLSGMKPDEYKKTIDNFSKLYNVYPVCSEINNPYARLLTSCNRLKEAHEVLRMGIRDTLIHNGIIISSENAKTKILGILLSSMLYDKESNKEKATEEYISLGKYIEKLFPLDNLGNSIIQEDEAYKDRHYRRNAMDMDVALYRNTTDWYYKDQMSTEWSRQRLYEISSEMRQRGLMSEGEIKVNGSPLNIYFPITLSNKNYVLIAVQSLVTRLSKGEDAEKAQLISMIMDEKVSDKVRKQLQGLYDQVEALKLSKNEIVNNVIMYAPVQDPAKTKEENKAAATEFYRIRDAINNVYHLDWLEKK